MAYLGNSPGVASQRVVTTFTATAGQTVFTPQSGYTLGYCDVFLNGIKLVNGDDYTASNGTSITLTSGAAVGDSVEVVAYFPRGLSDGYLKSEADAKYVAKTGGTMTGSLGIGVASNTGKLDVLTYGTAFPVPAQGSIGGSSATKINILGTEPGVISTTDLNFANGTQTGVATASVGTALGFFNVNDVRAQVFWAGNNVPLSFTNASTPTGSATERVRIDSAGRVTMPYQPAFRAGINTTSIASSSVVAFSTAIDGGWQRGTYFNNSTSTFTAPVGGIYHFSVQVRPNNANQASFSGNIYLQINGTGVARLYRGPATYATFENWTYSIPLNLSTNDNVRVWMQDSGAGAWAVDQSYVNWFSGHLIG